MAYRALYSKYLHNFNLVKNYPSVANIGNSLNHQPKMLLSTFQKPVEKSTKLKVSSLKRYYELIPLFVIVGGGITGLMFYVARIAFTRDDVRYNPKGKMPYEVFDMEKDKPPKARKFLVFNQKYETPNGLVEAMEAIKEEDKSKDPVKKCK